MVSHGHTRGGRQTPEYRAWAAMIRRVEHPQPGDVGVYAHVTICGRWRNSFAAFLKDMGPKPSPLHSLDRRDGARGYEPDNCRWATKREQSLNRRGALVDSDVPIKLTAEELGLKYQTVRGRFMRGDRGADLVRPIGSRCPVGERSPTAKLTEAKVREILASADSQMKLAKRYGVAPSLIHGIKSGTRWRHVKREEDRSP